VFAAVAAEAGRLLGADATVMSRYNPDGGATIVAERVSRAVHAVLSASAAMSAMKAMHTSHQPAV
jgi:hypothetical protein